MLIDFHTHVYPEKIAEKGVEYIGNFYGLPMREKGTIDHLHQVAAESGTTHVVLLGVAIRPDLVNSINRFTASLIDEHTIGFGTIHAGCEDKRSILRHCAALGLKGIKVHPDMQGFPIDDPRMEEVYEFLSQEHIPILFHMGDSRYDFSHPKRLAAVMDAFPGLSVIAAHFGGYQRWEESLRFLCGRPNLWMDTSSSLMFMDISLAKQILKAHGYQHFLFGTDYPITDQKEELKRLELLELTETEKRAILYENAARLLHIGDFE